MTNKRITIKDKTFELTIPESEIMNAVSKVAAQLKNDYEGLNPVFVVVLNGAFVFGADIIRLTDYPCEIAFTKVMSYEGTHSVGTVSEQLPVGKGVEGRHVVIIEDIVETGYTMDYLISRIKEHHPASVEICAFSFKPEKLKVEGVNVKYVGMTLPEAFIVGYGLDYDQQGRQLRDIYSLCD